MKSKNKYQNEGSVVERPLISFMILAYNQESFIREAVEGAFAQTYSPLEIVISDDCSSDRTYKIIEEMVASYQGPHSVMLNRNEKNLGLAGHINALMLLVNGDFVVLAAGDDISLPSRAERSWEILIEKEECTCVSFSAISFTDKVDKDIINNNGVQETNKSCQLFSINDLIINCDFHINGAARTIRKSVFDYFGPLDPKTPTEDSTILLRCMLTGSVINSKEQLVLYRIHGNNYYASDRKYSINYNLIHEQYLADIKIAKNAGVLKDTILANVEKSLSKRLLKRQLRSEYYFSGKSLVFLTRSILISRAFRLKEKIKLLKNCISSRIKLDNRF